MRTSWNFWSVFLVTGLVICNCLFAQQGDEKTQESDLDRQLKMAKGLDEGDKLLGKGEYAKAAKVFSELYKAFPKRHALLMYRARAYFCEGKIKDAIADYDVIIKHEESSKPYLWQRGLALYYASEFEKGVEQFESHQTVNTNDVENAAWHFLCVARKDGLEEARKKLIPIEGDTRVPMAEVHKLFAGKATQQEVLDTAKKAKSKSAEYYAHLYIGLYLEAKGEKKEALRQMELAKAVNPYKADVLMGQIANIHLMLRKNDKPKQGAK